MKRTVVTGMLLSALASPSLCTAFADLKGEVVVPKSFCWTGIYLGGNIGGKWGRFTESVTTNSSFLGLLRFPTETVPFNKSEGSFTSGAQIGYNQQINSFLLGLETDFNGMRLRAKETLGNEALKTSNYLPGDSFRTRSYWESSVRARAGYVFRQNWLLYLTGGLALTDVQIKADFIQSKSGTLTFPQATGSSSRVLLGGTVGVGTEYAFMSHWSLGGEYRYTSYQTKSVHLASLATIGAPTLAGPLFVYAPVSARIRLYTNEVLFKVNYNFA